MASRRHFCFFIIAGTVLLAACTTVQTASERQTYFENTSRVKLAWQSMPNVPTSFQGCEWGGESYPCQPYSKLNVPKVSSPDSTKSSTKVSSALKKVQKRKAHVKPKPLPMCQPLPVENTNVALANASSPITKTPHIS
jgi:hypothetical protein